MFEEAEKARSVSEPDQDSELDRAALRADPFGRLSELRDVSHRVRSARVKAMNYTIRHVTKFAYEEPISESVMEARMQLTPGRPAGSRRCRAG